MASRKSRKGTAEKRAAEKRTAAAQASRHRGDVPAASTGPLVSARFTRADALAAAALALMIAVSYFPATRFGFVWDDVIITTLDAIREWGGIVDLWFAPGTAYRQGIVGEDHYWPLLYTTFWIEHKLWGFAPAGYHAVNLILHFVNTVLLWRLLLRLSVPGAWFIAAVFAVHPLHVESVAWVIARKDLLSAMFYLMAFSAWLRFVDAPRAGNYLLVMALFAAGMLCKSIVVTFPAALLVWHWWRHGRVTGTDCARLVPLFLLAVALAAVDLAIYERVSLAFDYSVTQRTLMAAQSLWFYAGKLLWPFHLALLYPQWDLEGPLAWAALVAAFAVFASLWFPRHRIGRGPLACALFFALTLAPVLGFKDFGYMNMSFAADRYQYLAGTGILILVAGGAARGTARLAHPWKKAAAGLAGVVLAVLGAASWLQSGVYKDDATLFTHAAATNPGSWAARYHAALELRKLKRYDEAEDHFRRSLELRPRDYTGRHRRDVLQHIADTFRLRERYEEAIVAYRRVAAEFPDFPMAHAGLGYSLFRLQRHEEAIVALERSLALKPPSSAAEGLRRLFATTLDSAAWGRFADARYSEALDLYRKLAALDDGNARVHANLGATLQRLDRLEDARRSFERALDLDPDLALARAGLKEVRERLRRRGQ
ncbi:MAG: tetratricopeptide repeat protein [Deltaproteobacteria bacterium]|nr:tetratricopeptide repeat protein [Deltaproteobacteria bacterium]